MIEISQLRKCDSASGSRAPAYRQTRIRVSRCALPGQR